MWAPQISNEESQRRIRYIRNALKKTPIRVKWNEPDQSWLEGIFARGDRRLTSVLIEAWLLGARFDAWRDYFNMEIWKRAFQKSSLDPGFYLYRIRSLDESLPWDHIHSGVTKNYLKREWIMAQEGKETPDCRKTCLQCGVCDHETVDLKTADAWDSSFLPKRTPVELPPIDIKKYRITYSKKGTAKHLSHLELAQVFIRAINRAGLTPVFSKGYHPMPKVSFLSALPIGTESLDETVDIELQESLSEWEVKNKLGRQLPNGLDILNIKDISKVHKKSIIKESHYEITFFNYKIDPIPLQRFLQSDHYPIATYSAGKKKIVDARPLVKHINLTPPDGIYMILKHVSGPNIKPIDVMKEVFQIDNDHINGTNILKTKQVIE
jgi:radical SAM-linked protein